MDTPLLKIILSCFTCCLFIFHVVVGVHDVGGDNPIHTLQPHRCLDEERSALWEFKQGLNIARYNGSASYHKTDSWKAGGDCCSGWDGVECDQITGHVIGLDLSDNEISGSLRGNNTLFQLFHLQNLNLSGNDLQGQIPSSIFHLPKLRILDLSFNYGVSGSFPESEGSSSLEELTIRYCYLTDLMSLGRLANLTYLDISYNAFDGFNSSSFSWLSNLTKLSILSLEGMYVNGEIPSQISHLTALTYLDLSFNNFRGQMTQTWLSNLTLLGTLDLSFNKLTGQIPSSLSTLTSLEKLWMKHNSLTGSIPSLANLTILKHFDLLFNRLEGEIPNSFARLSELQFLNLYSNNLNGTVELDMFHKLGALSTLKLSQNNLTLLVNEGVDSVVLDKYEVLGLGSCNLRRFPAFLLNQTRLNWLDVSQNSIHGMVPIWIWNHSLSISSLNFSHNFLTTIEDHPIFLPSSTLRTLDVSFNMLQGSLPVPPLSTRFYLASNNRWSGHLSPLFCNLNQLTVLDASNNNISGTIPRCLGTYGTSLSVLNLRNNRLYGTIPQSWRNGSSLKMIALSQNQLQGKIPRSLGNCEELEFIDFGNNQIVDTFPSWLGALPGLKVLMLQSNRFHGEIANLESNSQFAQLQIVDISFNGFSGKIPSMYFKSWEYMQSLDRDKMIEYMEIQFSDDWVYKSYEDGYYVYSVEINNKGMERLYSKIPNLFRAIDFSHNQFEGDIPASIAKLKGLHLLNLGHNNLIGIVPSWLGDLRQLESLDLSHNKLSGKIPMELSQLSFLSFFSVSYNNLSGIIPHGGQFDTFGSSSYESNPGLLAYHPTQPPTPTPKTGEEEEDEPMFDKIEWMVILIGCGSGLVVGVVLGNELVVRKPIWFVKLLGRWL